MKITKIKNNKINLNNIKKYQIIITINLILKYYKNDEKNQCLLKYAYNLSILFKNYFKGLCMKDYPQMVKYKNIFNNIDILYTKINT